MREYRADARRVVAAPVTRSDHGLVGELVRDTKSRSKPQIVGLDAHISRHAADACHNCFAGGGVKRGAAARLGCDLRQIVLIPQPEGERELGSDAPLVLSEEIETRLTEGGIEARASIVLLEISRKSQQEGT